MFDAVDKESMYSPRKVFSHISDPMTQCKNNPLKGLVAFVGKNRSNKFGAR